MNENINKLYEALAKAQSTFKTPKKDKKAHYGLYASIGSINEAVRESMTSNGLSIIQPIVYIEGRTYVKTIITHSSGASVESILSLPEITNKGANYFHLLGSAISYLRRYALQSILGISADDVEDDGDSLKGVEVDKKFKDEMPKHLQQELFDLFDSLSEDKKSMFLNGIGSVGFTEIDRLPKSEYQNAKNYLVQLVNSVTSRGNNV